MKNRFLAATLTLLMIASCFTLMTGATSISQQPLTLQQYLSSSRAITDETIGYGYDNFSFFINPDDNNYIYKINKTNHTTSLVYQDSFTEVYTHKNYLYCIDGDKVVKLSTSGQYIGIVFDGSNTVRDLYADDYALYFIMGNSVYRYFLNESKLDALITHNNLYTFIPVSNHIIEWNYETQEWLDYLEETGDDSNSLGVLSHIVNSTNILNNETVTVSDFTKYLELNDTLIDVPISVMRSISAYTTINGNDIPHADYPSNSYFSTTGAACTCHSYCTTETSCYCKIGRNRSGGIAKQCHGFGCFMYRYIWNLTDTQDFPSSREQSATTFSTNTTTAQSQAENYIETNLGPGSLIRFNKRSGSQHTVVVVALNQTYNGDSNYLVVYHGNVSEPCQVMLQYMSYEYIAATYSGIHHAYN